MRDFSAWEGTVMQFLANVNVMAERAQKDWAQQFANRHALMLKHRHEQEQTLFYIMLLRKKYE